MSGLKISETTEATSLAAGDIFPIVSGGSNYIITWANIQSSPATKYTFDTTNTTVPEHGEIAWDAVDNSLSVGVNDGSVVVKIGENSVHRVTNTSGALIEKGSLVYASGTLEASGRIVASKYTLGTPSNKILGLVAADIPDATNGFVFEFGKITGIDTSGTPVSEIWGSGDILYPGDNGTLTNVKPSAPNSKTAVAVVIRASVTDGVLLVHPRLSSNLGDDDFVELTALADGDIIVYNNTTSRFENVNIPTTDPANPGEVWWDSGALKVSQG